MNKAVVAALIAVIAALSAVPAGAAVNTPVAGPGAVVYGFATPRVVIIKSQPTTFYNLDSIAVHDFTSVAKDANNKPLFKTPTIGVGSAPVEGIDKLAPGDYEFLCTIHAETMVGIATIRE